MDSKEVIVSINLDQKTLRVGRLWLHSRGSQASASFEYEKSWLQHPLGFDLDPDLRRHTGTLHTPVGRAVFSCIEDCMPDRWGRLLMHRAHLAQASRYGLQKAREGALRPLVESDYLLKVNDELRMGALRFSAPEKENVFLSTSDKTSVPPVVQLNQLFIAAQNFLKANEGVDDLKLLLQPGSSLGGARPKACVRGADGQLFLAKFSKPDDAYNVVAWEAVALSLAQKAGLQTPNWQLKRIHNTDVLLVQRFDRQILDGGELVRVPFLSAMSLLGARDNQTRSYLEIAYSLLQYGARPTRDLHELWRRIVLSVLISNTDDHLRNHGFLWARGWVLSPVYDLNPRPAHLSPRHLSTAIDFDNTEASLDLALSVAGEFKLSQDEARGIVAEVQDVVKQWPQVARQLGLTQQQCQYMRTAFQV